MDWFCSRVFSALVSFFVDVCYNKLASVSCQMHVNLQHILPSSHLSTLAAELLRGNSTRLRYTTFSIITQHADSPHHTTPPVRWFISCFYCFYVACSARYVYYCVVLYVSDVRLSHLNKDYLLTFLTTLQFSSMCLQTMIVNILICSLTDRVKPID